MHGRQGRLCGSMRTSEPRRGPPRSLLEVLVRLGQTVGRLSSDPSASQARGVIQEMPQDFEETANRNSVQLELQTHRLVASDVENRKFRRTTMRHLDGRTVHGLQPRRQVVSETNRDKFRQI